MKTQEFIDRDLISATPAEMSTGNSDSGRLPPSVGTNGRDEPAARIEQARQQMLELRRQLEELDRERQELEELRRREEEFENGKTEMLEELSRTITMIEQEEFELNKRSTLLSNFREVYQGYVHQLQDIRESEWAGGELKSQLVKAFSVVEAARAELNKGRAHLSFLGDGPLQLASGPAPAVQSSAVAASGSAFSFESEFYRGLARSLPLIIFGAVALILILYYAK